MLSVVFVGRQFGLNRPKKFFDCNQPYCSVNPVKKRSLVILLTDRSSSITVERTPPLMVILHLFAGRKRESCLGGEDARCRNSPGSTREWRRSEDGSGGTAENHEGRNCYNCVSVFMAKERAKGNKVAARNGKSPHSR